MLSHLNLKIKYRQSGIDESNLEAAVVVLDTSDTGEETEGDNGENEDG